MLVIRLARQGAHKVPFYHINLADRRRARNGRFIEKLGFYNPLAKGEEVCIRVNRERVDYWVERGALPSETVGNLIKKLNKAGGISELLGKDRQRRRIKGKKKEESAEQLAEQTEYAAERGAGVKTEVEETPPQPTVEKEAKTEAESSAPPEETPPQPAAEKEAKTEVESSAPPEETPSKSAAAKEAKTEAESSAPPEETPSKSVAAKEAKTEAESSAPPEETPSKSAAAKEAKTEVESSPPTKETPKGSEEPKK